MLMYVYMHCLIPVLSCPMLYLPWGGALAHVDLEELDFSVQTGRGQSCAIRGESSIHHSLQSKPFPIMPTPILINHTMLKKSSKNVNACFYQYVIYMSYLL